MATLPMIGDKVRYLGGIIGSDLSRGSLYEVYDTDTNGDLYITDGNGNDIFIDGESVDKFELVSERFKKPQRITIHPLAWGMPADHSRPIKRTEAELLEDIAQRVARIEERTKACRCCGCECE